MVSSEPIGLNSAGLDYLLTRLKFVISRPSAYKDTDFFKAIQSSVQDSKQNYTLDQAWSQVLTACGSYAHSSKDADDFLKQATALLPHANGDWRIVDRLLKLFGSYGDPYSSAEEFLKNTGGIDFAFPSNTVWYPLYARGHWNAPAPKNPPIFTPGDEVQVGNFEAFWSSMWTLDPSWTFLKMMDFGAPEYVNRQDLSEIVTAGYRVVKTLLQGTFDVFKTDIRTVWTPPTSGDVWTFDTGSILFPAKLSTSQIKTLQQMQDLVILTKQPTAIAALIIKNLVSKEKMLALSEDEFVTAVTSLKYAPVTSALASIIYQSLPRPPPPPPPSSPPPSPPTKPKPDPSSPHKKVRKQDLNDPANPAALTSVDPNAGPRSSHPEHATVNDLVGGADLLTVDDELTTITSPSAYFVDLLELLKQTIAVYADGPIPAQSRLYDLLIARRPDLPYLQLSIENTNVAMPYLDLVNEIMTQVIYAKDPQSSDKPVYYNTGFGEQSRDLLAQPMHIDYNVYKYITGKVPIRSLPYDPHLHRMRALLRAMGTSLLDLMIGFPSTEDQLGFEALATEGRDRLVYTEFLGISDEEVSWIISEEPGDAKNIRTLWGIPDSVPDAAIPTRLSCIKDQVLPRAGIELSDLSRILKTDYINPGAMKPNGNFNMNMDMDPGPVVIIDSGNDGTPGLLPNMKLLRRGLETLTWDQLRRLQIFTRIWTHLNAIEAWDVDDLDHALTLFTNRDGKDFDITLGQISFLSQIAKLTRLDVRRVMVLFGDMSMALYREIFVRHDLAAMDPVFQWDSEIGEYLGDKDLKVADHVPVILAALRLPSKDFPLLLEHLGTTGQEPLNFETLSSYLGTILLRDAFGISLSEMKILQGFREVFEHGATPQDLLRSLKKWQKLTTRTFNVGEAIFIATGQDPDMIGSNLKQTLPAAAALGARLSLIESQYPDVPTPTGNGNDHADDGGDDQKGRSIGDVVTQLASTLFGSQSSKEILRFLGGQKVVRITVHPPSAIPSSFTSTPRLKVSQEEEGVLIVTGLLTNSELSSAISLGSQPAWVSALNSIRSLARDFYWDTMGDVLEDESIAADLEAALLQGDDAAPNTAHVKRTKFLQAFVPLLRRRLMRKAVGEFVGSGVLHGLTTEMITSLLRKHPPDADTPTSISVQTIAEELMAIRSGIYDPSEGFEGHLVPGSTDSYRFIADAGVGGSDLSITIDKQAYVFKQQFDGSKFQVTDLIPLTGGQAYDFSATAGIEGLQWRAQQSLQQTAPVEALVTLSSSSSLMRETNWLMRFRMVVERLHLDPNEVSVMDTRLSWEFLDYLMNYIDLRTYIVSQKGNVGTSAVADKLISVFPLRIDPGNEPRYGIDDICHATGWLPRDIRPFASFTSADTVTWQGMLQIKSQLEMCKNLGVLVGDVYRWISLRKSGAFDDRQKGADKLTLLYNNSPRMSHEQWEQTAAGAVYDELRDRHRKAQVGFLLQQDWLDGIDDADALFEYLLVDTQMGASLETSRTKQAISAVQLFVQRCLLGLEAEGTLRITNLDAFVSQWNWMSKYRVWESNRKIFLFPENWTDPTLRDDKSTPFETFESNLLRSPLSEKNITGAILDYVHDAYQVRSLSIEATYTQRGPPTVGSTPGPIESIHYFGRILSTPYEFFHRIFSNEAGTWTPWNKIGAQITVVESDSSGVPLERPGSFVVPYQYQGRLMLFLPQLLLKTSQKDDGTGIDIDASSSGGKTHVDPPGSSSILKYWEIKLAWTEFRNNKWSPKIVCPSALEHQKTSSPDQKKDALDLSLFRFCVGLPNELSGFADGGIQSTLVNATGQPTVAIWVDHADVHVGAFVWRNGCLEALPSTDGVLSLTTPYLTHFHKTVSSSNLQLLETSFSSRQYTVSATLSNTGSDPLSVPDVTNTTTLQDYKYQVRNLLVPRLMPMQDTDGVYAEIAQFGHSIGSPLAELERIEAFGGTSDGKGHVDFPHELRTPPAIYNWEVGFHIPAMVMDRAMAAQQYDIALKYARYIFDPRPAAKQTSYWKWPPFAEFNPASSSITDKTTLAEWKLHPFQPHAIARGRPLAYKKWVLIKYIQILIAYGDSYFRQNTLETIPLAIQLYIEASHIFGPRAQYAPQIGRTQTDRYQDLEAFTFDALSNLKVDMEYIFPFASTTDAYYDDNTIIPLGKASSEYFKYYSNPKMIELRALVDDRLNKIRSSLDINGVRRSLALFEPALDPGALVAAMARPGASISSVLGGMDSPLPNCRVRHILPGVLWLCHELKKFSFQYVGIRERQDAGALAALRASQYSAVQSILEEAQNREIDLAQKELAAIKAELDAPRMRLSYYRQLIGASDLDSLEETPQAIDKPSEDDEFRKNSFEKTQSENHLHALTVTAASEGFHALTGMLLALPNVSEKLQPFGTGVDFKLDAANAGKFIKYLAKAAEVVAKVYDYNAQVAATSNELMMRRQDRTLKANEAVYEIKSIQKKIEVGEAKIYDAQKKLYSQQQYVQQALEIEQFLRSKYTGKELFAWLENTYKSFHYQSYNLAYDIAKKAEKAFQFECGDDSLSFIRYGYWDDAHNGLGCGEGLYLDLKRLEQAHLTSRPYDFEVVKNFSLRAFQPLQLLLLRETGQAIFEIPELAYDLDFPGHYFRRIKTLSVTVDLAGDEAPHAGGVCCTLRLLENKYRVKTALRSAAQYAQQDPDAFRSDKIPVESIAVSSGVDDSGVFQLDFDGLHFLPFEGAGAISKWSLDFSSFRHFDYETIKDVVLQIKYTSKGGGDKLRENAVRAAETALKKASDGGLIALLDLRNDFPEEWAAFMSTTKGPRNMNLGKLKSRLPFFAQGQKPTSTRVSVLTTDAEVEGFQLSLSKGGQTGQAFGGAQQTPASDLRQFDVDFQGQIKTDWTLSFTPDATRTTPIEMMWMVVYYHLG